MKIWMALFVCVGLLSSCAEEEKPRGPKPPIYVNVRPTPAPEKEEVEVPSWKPTDKDIFGIWKRPCRSVNTGESLQEEVDFQSESLIHTTRHFSAAGCAPEAEKTKVSEELAWEDPWEPEVIEISSRFVRVWRAIFRKVKGQGEYTDYHALAHLVEENGQRALYLDWDTTAPKTLDKSKQRYTR